MLKTKHASYIVCDGCLEETDRAMIEKTVLVYHHLCADWRPSTVEASPAVRWTPTSKPAKPSASAPLQNSKPEAHHDTRPDTKRCGLTALWPIGCQQTDTGVYSCAVCGWVEGGRKLAETESHCAICSWPVGQHAHDCPLYSWPCGLCGALVSKRTEADHARSHAALPISTLNVCLCGDWPKQSPWLYCPWCGCTLYANHLYEHRTY